MHSSSKKRENFRDRLSGWQAPKPIKKITVLALFMAVLLVIYQPVTSFLDHFLTGPVLSTIQSSTLNDVIFWLSALFIIVVTYIRTAKYVPSFNHFLVLSGICFLYILTLIRGEPWHYTPLKSVGGLRYADLLLLFTACSIILILTVKKGGINSGQSELLDDSPLGESASDQLGYGLYADTIANKILNSQFKKSFAIGINGKWGLGKTSFFDLLKRNLKDKDIIEIDFNPWNSASPSAIIADFFDTLQEKIKPYHSSLSRLLLKYSAKLVEVDDNIVNKAINYSAKALSGQESINSLYNGINESLGRINKKLIIYIDDLDRLDTQEIVEVMRLIRNTANFQNTFFLCAYDKQYINDALKDHTSYGHSQFLEKIFQIEITLPRFRRDILRFKLAENLKNRMDEKYHDEINSSIHGNSTAAPANLGMWLDTMRDVTRLTNSLVINLHGLYGEVSIKDFIQIEAFRLKHQAVYDLLHKKKADFFKTSSPNSGKDQYFELTYGDDKQKRQTVLRGHLDEVKDQLNLTSDIIGDIDNYIGEIFSTNPLYSSSTKEQLSIVRPENFDRYFAYQLLAGDLSEVEFTAAFRLPLEGMKSRIKDWVEKGLVYELQKRIIQVKHFENREQFEKLIRAIFFLANIQSSDPTYSPIHGYDGNDLFDKLEDYNGRKAKTLYADKNGAEGLRAFVFSVLKSAQYPFIYESDFVRLATGKLFDQALFPLTVKELSDISISYLRQYCEKNDKVTIRLYQLFWNTSYKQYSSADGHTYQSIEIIPQEAKDFIIDFFRKDIDGLLYWSVDPEVFNEKLYAVSASLFRIFGSWDHFEAFLNEQDEDQWKYLAEFKDFFQLAKSDNFQHYIQFTFNVIPVANKRRS